jgi:predicted short-subunit dehydrogenase-like oxidoreductase (DUF2520 family)
VTPEKQAPSIVIVGAGAVARALGMALQAGGARPGLWSRRIDAAQEAAKAAGVAWLEDLPSPQSGTEVFLLAVRDTAIAAVADMLQDKGCLGSEQVLLHCSGATSAEDAFADQLDHVAGVGVLHPLRAIGASAITQEDWSRTTFGIQGSPKGIEKAVFLCKCIGGNELHLQAEQMPGYHAAAAIASNYLVTLFTLAAELLQAQELSSSDFAEGLIELGFSSLQNLREQGLQNALTGPILRGDVDTVRRHVKKVERTLPTGAGLYRELGLGTIAISRERGIAAEAELAEIAAILQGMGQP